MSTLTAIRKLTPSQHDDLNRLQKLHAKQERLLAQHFLMAMGKLTNKTSIDQIAYLLRAGNIDGVTRLVDDAIEKFSNVLGAVLALAGHNEASVWARKFHRLGKSAGFLDFTDRRVATTIASNKFNFTTNLMRQQRNLVRLALIQELRGDATYEQIATRFTHMVGLTDQQYKSVGVYRRALQAQRIENQTEANPVEIVKVDDSVDVLSPFMIDRMVNQYAQAQRKARADTIAATDGLKLINQGRYLAVSQAAESVGANGTKTWLHTTSIEPRETHLDTVGTTIDIDEPFDVGGVSMLYPGDQSLGAGPEDVINCKCGVSYDLQPGD